MGSGPVLAILLLAFVHFAAFGLLFWHLAGRDLLSTFRIGPEDDGPRGGDPPPPPPPPGGSPSRVRLREPARLADGYPRRPRRPEHAPGDEPVRAPARSSRRAN
jgi:hypothetical protein